MRPKPCGEKSRLVLPIISAAMVALMLTTTVGCGDFEESAPRSNIGGPVVDPDDTARALLPDEAPCTIHVEGFGDVDIEEDYIPNVVACENGNAPMEALKAQAIQARGYIYYKLFIAGADSVVNSEDDQVYDCSYADAEERHFEAARATRAEFLSWNGQIVAPFYVAGAIPANPDGDPVVNACQGTGGSDTTGTEHFVTYNLGKTDCGIEMTSLGWAPADCNSNPQNRGCASQNGQSCLADRGWTYEEMMPFYYGDDIQIERAGGECGGPWEEPTEYDLFCADQNDDGWHCFDDTERVFCEGDDGGDVETCPYGCSDGGCDEAPQDDDEDFCLDVADGAGWVCYNQRVRVECQDGDIVDHEVCNAGCINDKCVRTGQAPRDDGENGDGNGDDKDDDNGGDESGEAASLVTPSEGHAGGCQTTGVTIGSSAMTIVVIILSLLLISSRIAGRRRHPIRE